MAGEVSFKNDDLNKDISVNQNIQKYINCLSDGTRSVRQRTLDKIKGEFLSSHNLTADQYNDVFQALCTPLLRMLRYQSDQCRELSTKLVLGFCQKVEKPWDYLQHIIPVFVDRLGNIEIVETTEEIRLLQVEALSCLVDLCQQNINLFVKDIVQILQMTLMDPFPAVKKESCLCTEKVAKSSPEEFFQHGESLIVPLLKSLSHQHHKVRSVSLRAIGVVLQQTSGKEMDNVVSHIAQRTFDHSPPVRLMVTTVVGEWLLNLRDRYSYFHKLLPLLLTGLSDEVPEIEETSKKLFNQVGKKYELENEDELKEKGEIHISKHFELFMGENRSSIGCRTLIQRNFSKILPALLGDLTDWVINTRIKAALLLQNLVFYAEDHITMHLEPLLQSLYKSILDEEEAVVTNTCKCAELVGLFVEPAVYCRLVLPHLQTVSTSSTLACSAALAILAALVRGGNAELLNKQLKEICLAVSSADICCTVATEVHVQLNSFVSSVVLKPNLQLDEIDFMLFSILVHVIGITRDQSALDKAKLLLEELSKASNLSSVSDLVAKHGLLLLNNLKENICIWTANHPESFVFESLLLLAEESLPSLIDETVPILLTNLETKKDAELRMKLFTLTSKIAMKAVNSVQLQNTLQKHCVSLLRSAIIPNCVWQPGRVTAAVRAASMSCLWSLFRGHVVLTSHLNEVFPELITQIISCLDDDNQTTRIVTCKTMLRLLQERKDFFTVEHLNLIYPELLKRMDDSLDEIRILSTKAFSAYFKCFSDYDVNLYQLHLEAIFRGLLVHLDDPHEELQEAVLQALKDSIPIHPKLLRSKINEVRHKHRVKRYCDELITNIDAVLVSKLELEDRT